MPWFPNPQGVAEVVSLLEAAVQVKASTQTLTNARTRIEHLAATNSEFVRYLSFVFAQQNQFPVEVRALAGLILKNELKRNLTLWQSNSSDLLLFIHDSFLPCLEDANKLVRSTSAHVLAMLVAKTPLLKNSRLIIDLMECVKQPNYDLRDGASLALLFIAEDCPYQLLESDDAGRPLNLLIPFWIDCFASASLQVTIRERALQCLQVFLYSNPPAMQVSFLSLLQKLVALMRDPIMHGKVLETVTLCMETLPDAELPETEVFAQFAQFALQSVDNEVLERDACEFFESALRQDQYANYFTEENPDLLQELIPKLCTKLVHTDEDMFELESDMNVDSHVPDRLQDVLPPRMDTGKYLSPIEEDQQQQHQHDEEEEEEGGDEEGALHASPYWTTRRIAGLILETLSKRYQADVLLQLLMPTLAQQMQSTNWLQVEAAILCLGAISENQDIQRLLAQQSPQLVAFLCQQASISPHVLVRRISLWTLSRYAYTLCNSAQQMLPNALQVICRAFNDGNKKTQSAALVALRSLLIAVQDEGSAAIAILATLLPELISRMTPYLNVFQINNSILLLDCFAEIFQVGSEVDLWLHCPAHTLDFCLLALDRFKTMDMSHPAFDSLVNLLVNAYSYLPAGTLPMDAVMERSYVLLKSSASPHEVSLSLLQLINSLITSGYHNVPLPVLQLVYEVCVQGDEQDSDLVEVALGVLGDVCAYCPAQVFATLDLQHVFLRIAEELDSQAPDKQRNALWAMLELIKSNKQQVSAQTVERLVLNVGAIMLLRERRVDWVMSLGELCAIVCANLVLRDLPYFTHCFLQVGQRDSDVKEALLAWTKIVIRMSEDEPARELAIVGWCTFVRSQMGLVGSFVSIVLATLATLDFRNEGGGGTHTMLFDLARALQHQYQGEWDKKIKPLSPSCRVQLSEMYGI